MRMILRVSDVPADDLIVEAYIRTHQAAEDDDPDAWADSACWVLILDDPERAWSLILLLVQRVPDDVLSCVGVGELEDFVKRHAPDFIDRIEDRARSDPRFFEALCQIWLTRGRLPAEIEERVMRASRNSILLLDVDPDPPE